VQGLEAIAKKASLFVKENGKMFPDDFAHEHSLVFDTPKGLVVFNSCSHGGVDNIITEVLATFPEKEICAYIGGLHLYKATEADVRSLAKRTKETGIKKIITGHCTGDEAFAILKEELGDLLLQIVMHCQIAEEEGSFTLDDVITGITEKMVRRHPHVFGDKKVSGSKEVLENWEEIKLKEKEGKEDVGLFLPQAFDEAEDLISRARIRKGL
jgi:NTP pyrophosphatase (non-canonical NTP hydrolase)